MKRKRLDSADKREARGNKPPRLRFRQDRRTKLWHPVITIGNILLPCEGRPFMGFAKGERDAILVWIKQAVSESLFDCPRYIVNAETGKSAPNPDWDLMPYYEQDEKTGEWIEIQPRPSLEQEAAGNRLPISDEPAE